MRGPEVPKASRRSRAAKNDWRGCASAQTAASQPGLNPMSSGRPETGAAAGCGLGPSTPRRWKARGRRGRGPYRDFLEDLERVKAEVRAVAEARIFNESPVTWLKAAARDRPDEPGWTESVRHEHSGPDGGAIPIELIDRLMKEDAGGQA